MMRRSSTRKAYTLIELITSLAISVLVLSGAASAMILASRALPTPDDVPSATMDAQFAMEQLAGELFTAMQVTENTPTSITFTVADRDNNLVDETIRYAWSGVDGESLTRKYNLQNPVDIAANVHSFSLMYEVYDTQSETVTPETEVNSLTYASMPFDVATVENQFTISTNTWCGEYIIPMSAALPAGTTKWRLDEVFVRMKSTGTANGLMSVDFYVADASQRPTGSAFETIPVAESTLNAFTWTAVQLTLNSSPWLAPSQGVSLVITPEVVSPAFGFNTGVVLYQRPLLKPANMSFLETTSGSFPMNVHPDKSMTMFYAYGSAKTGGDVSTITINQLHSVGIGMQLGAQDAAHVTTAVRTLNRPTLPGL